MAEKKEYLYDYGGLDLFLENFVDAPELKRHLDELLLILVTHMCLVEREPDCGRELLELYAILSDLRDLFGNLEKKAD
ncbi:hypothetical protein ACFOUP_12330 [Belliella kenyensis]|uniref:Uncharacterized protein n=1 Tax=Belliella kenyensis TaxID=1472724 RepID=A0ABV8EMY5_9BACT|nr:hypothetical protein [Belliella kenyensis]MCH7400751.1 hypothetical protein [Belliella kenyensis]MCH7400760.1 hypothetical protein [Belliella kenyensis]MDN3601952.1 hypothetical protein [Belliella kenyensis]MDN3601962.1 hypothetical protein [Belliella kenyensis]